MSIKIESKYKKQLFTYLKRTDNNEDRSLWGWVGHIWQCSGVIVALPLEIAPGMGAGVVAQGCSMLYSLLQWAFFFWLLFFWI